MKIENDEQAFDRLLEAMTEELNSKDHRTAQVSLFPEKVFMIAVARISLESEHNKKAINQFLKAENDNEALCFKLFSKIKKSK